MTKKKSYTKGYETAFAVIADSMMKQYDNEGVAPQMLIIYSVDIWYVQSWDANRKLITAANEVLMDAIEEIFRERRKSC